ncbi:AAC(3) family N-acetyltransferase [Candidatus Pelagibacter sp.]|nr:AAC(3) family N-acetyltransferase [Candidatus Pelagibacter sp.]
MIKKEISFNEIYKSFKKLGLNRGDTVLVHSNIGSLGLVGNNLKDTINAYYKVLKKILGAKGTICVPAFYFDFNKKRIFDLKNSPITNEMGIFSKFILNQKTAKRSLNPLTSIAAVGSKAKEICNYRTASAYGEDSPFDIMTKLNAKMIFLGVDLRYMTYVHYVEQRVGVPQRFFKLYDGKITLGKKKFKMPIIGFVRYLNKNIINDIEGNNKKFSSKKITKKTKLGKKNIYLLEMKKTYDFLKLKLQKDCFYLLKKKPNI